MKTRSIAALLLGAAVLASPAWGQSKQGHAGHGHADHKHETFAAGEPGDPKKPAKIIQVSMTEADGKMLFAPERLEVRKGDQIKFVLRNNGELEHEFVLGTPAENIAHAEEMKKNPQMPHDEPNGKLLKPKTAGELFWRFTNAGEFEYACLIPGHREAGMIGIVVVK